MPEWFLVTGLYRYYLATIIASQALITGTFSLINEAMKLKFWPASRIRYPSESKWKNVYPRYELDTDDRKHTRRSHF